MPDSFGTQTPIMDWNLHKSEHFKGAKGPVVLVILDGVGEGTGDESDAVRRAYTPVLDSLRQPGLYTALQAHGLSVGLPSDGDMGNSEVGHNALGCGRIHEQGASLVGKAIASGEIYSGKAWIQSMARCAAGAGSQSHDAAGNAVVERLRSSGGRCSGPINPARTLTKAYSIAFSSSRTLPGQG